MQSANQALSGGPGGLPPASKIKEKKGSGSAPQPLSLRLRHRADIPACGGRGRGGHSPLREADTSLCGARRTLPAAGARRTLPGARRTLPAGRREADTSCRREADTSGWREAGTSCQVRHARAALRPCRSWSWGCLVTEILPRIRPWAGVFMALYLCFGLSTKSVPYSRHTAATR